MTEPRGAKLLPFYLLIDVSYSMQGPKMDSANAIMPSVVDAIAKNPILSDKVRFGVLDFGTDAQVQLPLCDVLDPDLTLPDLKPRGTTSYAKAFRLLREEIESNVKQLKADGFAVHRPAVFFLSDGMPNNDDWMSAFAELTGIPTYPNVIPCGVDEADGSVLAKLVHPAVGEKAMQLYMMDQDQNPASAINSIAEILVSSILASGESINDGRSGIVLPPKEDLPSGITAYDPDDFV